MIGVPLPAAVLGAAGLLPFIAGVLTIYGLMPGVGNPVTGYLVLQSYGAAILAFMGGCLWGFAAQAGQSSWKLLGISVTPGLWAFSTTFSPDALLSLIIGFFFLLVLDMLFRSWGLGPKWWLTLRIPLTVVVMICLGLGKLA